MNFQDAEKAYQELKQKHTAGKLTDEDFEAAVAEFLQQDEQGHWWQLGVETGEWYMHDGEKWSKAKPPIPAAPAAPTPAPVTPAAPTPAPPVSAAPAAPTPTPVADPKPPSPVAPSAAIPAPVPPSAPTLTPAEPAAPKAPATATPAPVTPTPPSPAPLVPAAATPAAPLPPPDSVHTVGVGAAQKNMPDGDLPAAQRRSAPAGRASRKGLPTPILIGIIAVVGVIAMLIAIGGFIFIRGMLGSSATARATSTPTRSLALLPTLTLAVPSDTPLPTIEVTPTEQVTPTRPRPTATKNPPTPAGPPATATLNVPPGVYVTNIETIPSNVNIGDTIGFKVSFVNTTGSMQTYNWRIQVYTCPDQCQDFRHSYGETQYVNSNLPAGTTAVSTAQNINVGRGISCDLIAVANYVDPVNQMPTPFQSTKNEGHFSFTPCH